MIQKARALLGHGIRLAQDRKKLNSYPQLHHRNRRSRHPLHSHPFEHENALPLVVTHGWPGSIIEQIKIIDPLTDPTAHGGTASDAFHVVIPSMAGYGFSARPTAKGWDAPRMARAWTVLMKRLGYTRLVAQGGDWARPSPSRWACRRRRNCSASTPTCHPPCPPKSGRRSRPANRPTVSAPTNACFRTIAFFFTHGVSYAQQMANHPQTLYAIADSPVGLAAWFLDHDLLSYELIARAFDGQREGLTRDDVLDNITLTWLTNTAISTSASLPREQAAVLRADGRQGSGRDQRLSG